MRAFAGAIVGCGAALAVDFAARAAARAEFGSWVARDVLAQAAVLPTLISGCASARAVHVYGNRALGIVLAFALTPLAYWKYRGEYAHLMALAAHRWTASALSSAFSSAYAVVCMLIGVALAFLIVRRRHVRARRNVAV